MDTKSDSPLVLEVKNLRTYFYTEDGVVKAVNDVDFKIRHGEVLGLVGESGSGKSVTSLTIMRLIGIPGQVEGGEVIFQGRDLLKLDEDEMVDIRGNAISMIFQQPTSCLNPVFRIGDQVAEVMQIHQKLGQEVAWQRAIEMLRKVGIPNPEARAKSFPHEISGGQAQRVMIAMALACVPDLLIADEPTTALDVTIQAQILDLMRSLRDELGTSILLITHDLGVVAEMCDSVAVMYAGRIVEYTDVNTIFSEPLHPYTEGLLASIPILGEVKERLAVIPGSVPNLIDLPQDLCHFAPRCPYQPGHSVCVEQSPPLYPYQENHLVRCWRFVPETQGQWEDRPQTLWPGWGYVAWLTGEDWLDNVGLGHLQRLSCQNIETSCSKGVLRGDFGESWTVARGQSVAQVLGSRLRNTVLLTVTATLLSIIVAIPIGIFSAVRQYSRSDYVLTTFAFFGTAMPVFWFAMMMILLFGGNQSIWYKSTGLPYLPTGNVSLVRAPLPGSLHDLLNITPGSWGDILIHLLMPALVLSLLYMAQWSRFMRTQMLEVLRQDYVRTARSKGLTERVVIYKHALRNALIPLITIIVFQIPGIFSGAIITETVFNWIGMGQLYIRSLGSLDYPVQMAFLFITAVLTVVATLLRDILYTVADPRIRFS